MTPDEINIAIAEFCGLSDFIKTDCGECYGFGLTGGEQDSGGCGCCKNGHIAPYYTGPDYLKDLNAIYEAEAKIPEEMRFRWGQTLEKVTSYESKRGLFTVARATAAQRCEALLKTIGKIP